MKKETPSVPSVSRKAITGQKARAVSELLLCEHELANARATVAAKERQCEQLRGGINMLESILSLPPEPESKEN